MKKFIIEDVKERLCYHDIRNPAHLLNLYGDEDCPQERPKNCSCDNCFYNRNDLAEQLLNYMELSQ